MHIRSERAGEGDIPSSEITPYETYLNRRRFMKAAGLAAAAAAVPGGLAACAADDAGEDGALAMANEPAQGDALEDELNSYEDITSYNNFYEFGTDKSDPAKNSDDFRPRPWSVEVAGECANPGTYGLEDFLRGHEVVEPIYRLRCVEAWSMVIPWQGVRLADVVRRLEPTGNARYIKFTTVFRPSEMPGQRRPILLWPYVEGLRLDEATNRLPLLATGIYGKSLLNQNGAPLRLVVPWKYGFKSIKSIVKIEFTEEMPLNTWQQMRADEYGFFANVNPEVDHPRWSQARERRIGELRRRPTLMFNGYGNEVAQLYAGMDLAKWY